MHWQKPPRKQDAPKYNIWLVNPDGSGVKHLTHDRAPFLLNGLIPVDWSADGTRLVADFGLQDTSYIVTVDPRTGAEHVVGPKTKGYYPAALSSDGTTIIGQTGGSLFNQPQKIFTIPYAGGKATMLASGELPDWNR
jgi:Tol biopolymer transport system component